ncbi:S1 family peptidase [Corynebacterium sp. HMSC05H05]|uniref:S1 family peptidase n=1 Tax=Corynebacterium sp. HMSC05H05 TaxID=1581119 RepID=UPI0008A39A4D|nr:S1 family peptidase [Corynebacterium sp. HMSC05H05]
MLVISALLTGCSGTSDDDLEAYRAEQDAAVADIAEMLNSPGSQPTISSPAPETTTASQRSYSRSESNYQNHSNYSGQRVEPPIRRDVIDPKNDASGQSGRDDNRGVYYHNSVDWEWLKQPGGVVPGGRIFNETQSMTCSTGFLASADGRLFIITAGHCGNRGDQFYVEDSRGNWAFVGEMVESYLEQDENGSIFGADIGLIEITGDAKYSSTLPVDLPLRGWITPQEAQARGMAICRLGATTGYSCGQFEEVGNNGLFYFRNINDRGDSGGAVFAADNSGVWAIGVSSNVSDTNKTRLGAMEIGSAIQHWGLTIHG